MSLSPRLCLRTFSKSVQSSSFPSIATAGVAFATFFVLLATSSILPYTWDEGEVARRAEGAVQGQWKGTVSAEGHPQFPVMLAAFGKTFAPSCLPERTRLRFGHVLFFALAMGAVFGRLRREFGVKTAWFGVLSILLVPRLFAHAQIAVWDSPLMASWMLTWAVFPLAFQNNRGALIFGCAVGLTLSSKFSGWPVVLPFMIWTALWMLLGKKMSSGREDVLATLGRFLLSAATSLLVFFFLNPPLWFDPVGGMKSFLYLNTHRTLRISTLFLGQMYDLYHSLPWYNTIFWAMTTVPSGLLFLFAVGVFDVVRDERKRWPGLLILLNMATLLVVRACPGTPVHDGVRLFVAAFPFLGIIVGIGAVKLWSFTGRKKIAARCAVVLVYGICLFNMFWYAPHWLSYYNALIGGPPGAVGAGMEPTYYLDGIDDEVLDWLNAHVKPDERVLFSHGAGDTFDLYVRDGRIRFSFDFVPYTDKTCDELKNLGFRYYVLPHRYGILLAHDWELLKEHKPVYVKTIRRGGFGPWNLGAVPILGVYDLSK